MRVGDLIAERFELEHLAGTGGMCAVYRARDLRTGERVAVKSLTDPGGRHADRFLREAEVLATLHHPNVVRYLSHGRTESGELFMAMEWVEGESLSARIGSAGLSVRDTLEVVTQLASALAVAHARGVVHRDIKPSNVILVHGTLTPKLLDFGIARLQEAARLTSNGMMLGTPGYMAPEQARGAATVTARADVFSLGCLLFKCLAARPPFVGQDMRAVMAQVLFEPAPRLLSLQPSVPGPLDALVDRMLAKEPSQRPADGAEVLAELRQVSAEVPGLEASPEALGECIGHKELQLVCAVLARAPAARPGEVPVVQFPAPAPPDPQRTSSAFEMPITGEGREISSEIGTVIDAMERAPDEVIEALRNFDVEVDRLADGSLLCALIEPAEPVALAVRAVRCAMAMRSQRPELRVVVTTGRALRSDHPGVGPALDRAAALLRSTIDGPPGIVLDAATTVLLRGRFEISGSGRLGASLEPLRSAGPTLVGRERELGRLVDFVERTLRARRPAWGLLIGAQGVGLTAMLQGLIPRLGEVPSAPALRVATGDPAERHLALGCLRRLLPELATPIDAQGLAAVLAECASASGLVLVLDDLEHVDDASLQLLAQALPGVTGAVAVVCTARPRTLDRVERLGLGGELRELSPLPTEAMTVLARGRVDPARVALARGNPWLLEALAAQDPGARELPEAALVRVAGRLEELSPEARRVLRAVAIWEREVTRSDLAALLSAGAADASSDAQLEVLVRGGWIERLAQGGLWGEPSFRVVDPLVAAAARAQFPEGDRARAHRLCAMRLEQRAEPDPAEAARHWEGAGQPARAVVHSVRGANAALGEGQLMRAAELARMGLRWARDPISRAALLEVASEAELWCGTAADALEAARQLAGSVPPRSHGEALAARCTAVATFLRADLTQARTLATELLGAIPWADASAAHAAALCASTLMLGNARAEAEALIAQLPVSADDALEPLAAAARLHVEGCRLAHAGLHGAAEQAHRAAAEALIQAEEPRLAVLSTLQAALSVLDGNVFERAELELARLTSELTALGLQPLRARAALGRALALDRLGRLEASNAALEESLAVARDRGEDVVHALALRLRAQQLAAQGALGPALDTVLRALPHLEPLPVERLASQALVADLHRKRGELNAAVAIARKLASELASLEADGGAPVFAVLRVVAEVQLQAGLRDAGRAQLHRARTLLTAHLAKLEEPWHTALSREPDVARLVELGTLWLGPA